MSATTLLRRHQLAAFLAGSVALGWLVTYLSAQLPSSSPLLPLIAIPVSYIPAALAVLAIVVVGTTQDKRRFRSSLTTLRFGWRWVAFALLLPAIHLIGIAIGVAAGGSVSLHPEMLALLPLFLLTNFGEEIGWRGYALPRLQERMSPLVAAILVGLVWAVFHWVALLGNRDNAMGYVVVATVQLVGMSVILGIVFNNARQSVLAVTLVHAAYDTVSIGVAPLAETGVPLFAFASSAALTCLAAFTLVLITGRSLRLGRPSHPGATTHVPAEA